MKPFPSFLRAIPAVLMLFSLGACAKSNHISTNAAGHAITAIISGEHSIESHEDYGVISSPYGTVTIEPARMKLDGASWTAIPARIPMEVRISRGRVSLTAGNVTVERTQN